MREAWDDPTGRSRQSEEDHKLHNKNAIVVTGENEGVLTEEAAKIAAAAAAAAAQRAAEEAELAKARLLHIGKVPLSQVDWASKGADTHPL